MKAPKQDETDESSTAVGFRAAYVFDISQTDGQELPTIGSVNGEPREYRERLAKFVTEQGIALEYSEDIAPARGTSAGGKITLLPGQSPAEEFATLAHELAHEMMHRDERRSSTSKRSRETEAEAVAFVVCHAIGLETGSASQDYIQLYEGDAKLLTESLEHIQKTATQILNAIGAEVYLRADCVSSGLLDYATKWYATQSAMDLRPLRRPVISEPKRTLEDLDFDIKLHRSPRNRPNTSLLKRSYSPEATKERRQGNADRSKRNCIAFSSPPWCKVVSL